MHLVQSETVASLGLVSPGATTEGVTPFFPKKATTFLVITVHPCSANLSKNWEAPYSIFTQSPDTWDSTYHDRKQRYRTWALEMMLVM